MSIRLPVAALLFAAGAASAQITTDRPGFGYSPVAVGAGVFQVEAGTPQGTLGPGTDAYAFPVMLRYGVTPAVEVRVAASVLDATAGGALDVDLGFRSVTAGVLVSATAGAVVLAAVPEVVVPTDGGGAVAFQLTAPASVPLGDFGLTVSPGVAAGRGAAQATAVVVVSRSFGGALSGYVEGGAFPPLRGGGGVPVVGGGGVAVVLGRDVQLDAFFDTGLTDAAPDLLVGVGVSFRVD